MAAPCRRCPRTCRERSHHLRAGEDVARRGVELAHASPSTCSRSALGGGGAAALRVDDVDLADVRVALAQASQDVVGAGALRQPVQHLGGVLERRAAHRRDGTDPGPHVRRNRPHGEEARGERDAHVAGSGSKATIDMLLISGVAAAVRAGLLPAAARVTRRTSTPVRRGLLSSDACAPPRIG